MCRVPVTFGGGNWMQKAGASLRIEGLNKPFDSQNGYHFRSIARGSKLFASSMGVVAGETLNYRGWHFASGSEPNITDRGQLRVQRRASRPSVSRTRKASGPGPHRTTPHMDSGAPR